MGGFRLNNRTRGGQFSTEGRLIKLAERPLPLQTGYYFVHVPNARNRQLRKHLCGWAIAAAGPFRAA